MALEPSDPRLQAFVAAHGLAGSAIDLVDADWSQRGFYRVHADDRTAIVMHWPGGAVAALPAMSAQFEAHGVRVPHIYAVDTASELVLLEDFGVRTMAQRLDDGEPAEPMLTAAIDLLIHLHKAFPAREMEAVPRFGAGDAADRAARFCDFYLPSIGAPLAPGDRARFLALWRLTWPVAEQVPHTLAHYDFHPGNLFWHPVPGGATACGVIDFQDAVLAPLAFDLACLLQDIRRDYEPALLARLHARYCRTFPLLNREILDQAIAVIGAQRTSQILGNLGRARLEGRLRPRQEGDIARAWDRLRNDLAHPVNAALRAWYESHTPMGAPR